MWLRSFARAARRAAGVGGGVIAGAAAAGCFDAATHARSRDTCMDVFTQYSSLERDGVRFMTVDDFVKSLLRQKCVVPADGSTRSIEALFSEIDSDSDGLVSFQEYSLFMTLLTHSKDDIVNLFRMFDLDNSNTVELEEYKHMIRCLGNDRTVDYNFHGGLTDVFFGTPKDGEKPTPLTIDRLCDFVNGLRRRVLESQFRAFTSAGAGDAISHESFVKLLLFGGVLPAAVEENYPRVQAADRRASRVALGTWLFFSDLALSVGRLEAALGIFSRRDAPIGKHDFIRAVRAAADGGCAISRRDVETVFLLFGDVEGNLNHTVLVDVLKKRASWGLYAPNPGEPRRNFVQGVFHCVSSS